MKTHLPKGLRAALMAALAAVSLTSYANATDVTVNGDYYGYNQQGPLDLTFKPGSSFNRDDVTRLYVLTTNHTGDVSAAVQQSLLGSTDKGYYLVGMGSKISLDGSLNLRTVATGSSATNRGNVLGLDYSSTVTGNVYMGLADNNTYSGWVYGVMNSTVQGTSKLEIASGTFKGNVAVGYVNSWSPTNTVLNKGTELNITGGKFENIVAAGCVTTSGPGSAIINGGTHTTITGGTFSSTVYGGSTGANSTIDGGVDISITGGEFKSGSKVYALGSAGKVNGDVNLTIGNDAKFASNSVISAGANGSVNYSGVTSSTVMLDHLTDTSSLATDSSIKVMGGQQGSTLNMRQVKGTVNAQLSQFSHMVLSWESDLTLRQATNATLGGVSSVTLNNASTLTLQNDAGETWDLSGVTLKYTEGVGTLKKTGEGQLTIGDASAFGGALIVENGELTLSGATKANLTVASGATLSVKEGNLFAAGASNTISVSGATLAANEGNWTLNKAATVDGATITGSHAVAFGSEVDSDAKVTMSGNINATEGHLILKNTAIAADTTATLSGNITFEGVVDNQGTLAIANGSTINIDEQSLIRNGRFIDGPDTSASDTNGFFADTEVCLSTGGAYALGSGLKLTLDGVEDSKLQLITESKTKLLIGGLSLANTYFVREGDVKYSHIAGVAESIGRDVLEIAVGTNGADGTHQFTLDGTLAEGVKVVSASDHAKVLLSDGVELKASQTAIKGEANEVHVTYDKAETAHGTGYVLMDDTTKLSQLAGDATMKLSGDTTTFSTEAKMEGKLVVDEKQTLNLENNASIASFSSVELGAESKLVSKQAGNDSIKSLSGSGDLSKTGAGKLTVKDASGFTGEINASAGTLELEGVDLTGTIDSKRKVSVSGGATVNLVGMEHGADVTMTELTIDGGTFGVYSGTDAVESNVVGLTLANGSMIVIGQKGGTLEANLTTEGGSTLNFTAGVALTMGCDVNMGKGTNIVINSADFAKLQDGGMVTLFNGVDNSFCMDVTDYVFCELVTASEGSGDPKPTVYFQTVGDKAVLSTTRVPEPATGTLSLLALAGLCARRRRK